MKTQNIESRELFIPESWNDVSFEQYITYLKKIKPLNYTPSRLRLMDAVNGDGAQEIFDTMPDLITDLCFAHDGPPMLNFPKSIRVGIFIVDIKDPIPFHSQEQINDFNEFAIRLLPLSDFEKLEQAPIFCGLYCQPLIDSTYNKEKALELFESIGRAPVTEVLNLYTFVMLKLAQINSEEIKRLSINNYFNSRMN